jgi:lysozyme
MLAAWPRPSFSSIVKGAATALLVVALAACARSGGLYGGPIHGDNRPHSGVDRARNMPIQGIDIARYQGIVDFREARAAGMHFVFMKSTEGKDYIDPNFYENWRRARDAGIPRGAYHFMTWCSLASEQAAWFVRMVPNDPDALPPVLDLEWNNHSSCKNKPSRADAIEKVRVMLAAMEAHTGKLPIIYTDMNFHRDVLEREHFPNTFWLRSTAAEPHERYSDRGWTFWQWTQTGVVPGVRGEVDRNAFYGDQNDWINFLLTGCDPRAIPSLGPAGRCRIQK